MYLIAEVRSELYLCVVQEDEGCGSCGGRSHQLLLNAWSSIQGLGMNIVCS